MKVMMEALKFGYKVANKIVIKITYFDKIHEMIIKDLFKDKKLLEKIYPNILVEPMFYCSTITIWSKF